MSWPSRLSVHLRAQVQRQGCLSITNDLAVLRCAATQSPLPSTSYNLHTSAPTRGPRSAAQQRDQERRLKKEKREKQEVKDRLYELSKPDPVLGHQMNEVGQAVWNQSDLCKIILTKDEVWGVREDRRGNLTDISQEGSSTTTLPSSSGPFMGPKRLNFGLDNENDRKLLFSDLPAVMVDDHIRDLPDLSKYNADDLSKISQTLERTEERSRTDAQVLSRVLDLRNASGKGIQVENIRRIIDHFGGRKEGEVAAAAGLDTGSVEVQTAVITYRIRNLHEHLKAERHDNANRRAMASLVHQRAKLLKYLKRKSLPRYRALLPRLGIEARAVEGEVVVPGKPLMQIGT